MEELPLVSLNQRARLVQLLYTKHSSSTDLYIQTRGVSRDVFILRLPEGLLRKFVENAATDAGYTNLLSLGLNGSQGRIAAIKKLTKGGYDEMRANAQNYQGPTGP